MWKKLETRPANDGAPYDPERRVVWKIRYTYFSKIFKIIAHQSKICDAVPD